MYPSVQSAAGTVLIGAAVSATVQSEGPLWRSVGRGWRSQGDDEEECRGGLPRNRGVRGVRGANIRRIDFREAARNPNFR